MYVQEYDEAVLEAAESLFEDGYGFVPLNNDLTHAVHAQFAYLLEHINLDVMRDLAFELEKRPDGIYEPDDGIIYSGDKDSQLVKDLKWRFHYRPNSFELMHTRIPNHALSVFGRLCKNCQEIYGHHMEVVLSVLQTLERIQPELEGVCDKVITNWHSPVATSRPLLRVLHYMSRPDELLAREHFDRSFITLHAGDEGGELFAKLCDGTEVSLSPPKDHGAIFFGSKAKLCGEEMGVHLMPVKHGARGNAGEVRKAAVSFWHINKVLWNAEDAFTH